jgi:hypothetical protein
MQQSAFIAPERVFSLGRAHPFLSSYHRALFFLLLIQRTQSVSFLFYFTARIGDKVTSKNGISKSNLAMQRRS